MSIRLNDNPEKNKQKAIKILSDFVEKKLDGNFESLRHYSFWGIEKDKEFGNGLSYPDGDRTKLAYAISYLLFYEQLKDVNFRLYGYSTQDSTYSGETLNTFNTLFSSIEENRNEIANIYGTEKFKENCYNPENGIFGDDFYHVYQRLGNFSLFPCLTICGGSINTWKGTDGSIRDYLYPFLRHLEKGYKLYRKDILFHTEEYELLLLMERNSFFFDKIYNFEKFIELFMLEGWESLELKAYLKSSEITKKNIIIVDEYISKATTFIDSRTNRMVDRLKKILDK